MAGGISGQGPQGASNDGLQGKEVQEPRGNLGQRAVSWIKKEWSNASQLKKVALVATVATATLGAIAVTHGAAIAGIVSFIISGAIATHIGAIALTDKALPAPKASERQDSVTPYIQRNQLGYYSLGKHAERFEAQRSFADQLVHLTHDDLVQYSFLHNAPNHSRTENELLNSLSNDQKKVYNDARKAGAKTDAALRSALGSSPEGQKQLAKLNRCHDTHQAEQAANFLVGFPKDQVKEIIQAERHAIEHANPPLDPTEKEARLAHLEQIEKGENYPDQTYLQAFGGPIAGEEVFQMTAYELNTHNQQNTQ